MTRVGLGPYQSKPRGAEEKEEEGATACKQAKQESGEPAPCPSPAVRVLQGPGPRTIIYSYLTAPERSSLSLASRWLLYDRRAELMTVAVRDPGDLRSRALLRRLLSAGGMSGGGERR
jgi:hypothetical protein